MSSIITLILPTKILKRLLLAVHKLTIALRVAHRLLIRKDNGDIIPRQESSHGAQ